MNVIGSFFEENAHSSKKREKVIFLGQMKVQGVSNEGGKVIESFPYLADWFIFPMQLMLISQSKKVQGVSQNWNISFNNTSLLFFTMTQKNHFTL